MGPAAGGPTDAVGRVLATRLNEIWKQPVIVENRPGAGNTIATAAAAKATTDGYTLLFCPVSDAVAPSLYKQLPYDFTKEIAPVAHVGATPNIFVVPPSSPAKTMKEWIALAKANPGKLNYGGQGIGQSGHLTMELLRLLTGIDVVYVPYKSVGLVVTDLLAGRMDAQITNLPAHVENVRNGKLRALGVTSPKRSPRLPEVPAIAETVPGFELMVWYGVCAPAGVPKPIVNKVAADVQQALATPDVQKKMEGYGVDVQYMAPERFGAYIKAETAKWAKVIKAGGIQQQ
ncbi:MAG: tripartite tricarboxylate transporter substrate binding protein [Betaproteobacteria bacterium]|nr:tripartite tricarboxylate transporter substrate binding protein [Betaproteobacteria bacterium]